MDGCSSRPAARPQEQCVCAGQSCTQERCPPEDLEGFCKQPFTWSLAPNRSLRLSPLMIT